MRSCKFESCPGHQRRKSHLTINQLRFFISILHHICTTRNNNQATRARVSNPVLTLCTHCTLCARVRMSENSQQFTHEKANKKNRGPLRIPVAKRFAVLASVVESVASVHRRVERRKFAVPRPFPESISALGKYRARRMASASEENTPSR